MSTIREYEKLKLPANVLRTDWNAYVQAYLNLPEEHKQMELERLSTIQLAHLEIALNLAIDDPEKLIFEISLLTRIRKKRMLSVDRELETPKINETPNNWAIFASQLLKLPLTERRDYLLHFSDTELACLEIALPLAGVGPAELKFGTALLQETRRNRLLGETRDSPEHLLHHLPKISDELRSVRRITTITLILVAIPYVLSVISFLSSL